MQRFIVIHIVFMLCAIHLVSVIIYPEEAWGQARSNAVQQTVPPTNPTRADSSWLQTLSQFARLNGSASLLGELYTVPAGVQARRPPGTARLNVQATLTLFDQISIPFSLLVSTEQVQFRQSFNQFGIAPQLGKNVRLYGGYHTITFSQLSAGDVRSLGGGADIKAGNFRIVGTVGEVQRAVQPDTALRVPGAFARMLIAGRVAFESDSGAVIGLNVVRARDDVSSLQTPPNAEGAVRPVEAQDNLVATLDAQIPLFSKIITIETEVGASRNGALWAHPPAADCGVGVGLPVIDATRLRLDYAGRLVVNYANPASPLAIRLRGEYIGPGYTTLAYPQLVNDRFEADVAPQVRLFDSKLTVGGSIGYATDNLAGDRATTSSRLIGSVNCSAQITEEIGVDAQYQNYGIRVAPPPNYGVVQPMTPPQQLQTQQVFGLFSIAPRANFQLGTYYQNISLTASFQNFVDANSETRRATENAGQMLRLLWTTTIEKLALTLNAGYTSNQSALANFQATDVSLTGAHPLFDNKVTPALTLGWTKSSESSGLDSRFTANLRATYRITKQLDVALNAQGNYYAYKPGSRSPSYGEAQMSVEVRQRF